MELLSKIKKLSKTSDVDELSKIAAQCASDLKTWYEEKEKPNYRLLKLLKNYVFYLNESDSDLEYRNSLLTAIAKTLIRTAEFDLTIKDYPDKVRAYNKERISLCDELVKEDKQPVDEASDKPYDVTIIIATYNQIELTKLCLTSIFNNTDDVLYELYLIDNGSNDGTYEYFKQDSRVKLIRLEENTGLLLALHIFYESDLGGGKFWLYMNNDVLVTPRWLSNMLKCIKSDPKIGSVLPVTNRAAPFMCIQPPFGLYDLDDVQRFGEEYNNSNSKMWQDWAIYYGFVLLVRPSVRKKFGYYEDCFYYPFYYSDGDIIISQVAAGYRAVQSRDTYVHHFDGGHTDTRNRREMLAGGEKLFHEKHGFLPTDIERTLPAITVASTTVTPVNANANLASNAASRGTGAASNILFLGSGRIHPIMQLQHLNEIVGNKNVRYFAAGAIEQPILDKLNKSVQYKLLDSWYDVEAVFDGEVFDSVIYLESITDLRNPLKLLKSLYNRLCTNGKLYLMLENAGNLRTVNNSIMSRSISLRDAVRLKKASLMTLGDMLKLLGEAGYSVETVESIFYDEVYTYTRLSTLEKYRNLVEKINADEADRAEQSLKTQAYNIVARKPDVLNKEDTLEKSLFSK